jgi:hypothetical protein
MKGSNGLIVGFANDGVDGGQRETFNDRFDQGWHCVVIFGLARPLLLPGLMVDETECYIAHQKPGQPIQPFR